jgi:hypothetical protein
MNEFQEELTRENAENIMALINQCLLGKKINLFVVSNDPELIIPEKRETQLVENETPVSVMKLRHIVVFTVLTIKLVGEDDIELTTILGGCNDHEDEDPDYMAPTVAIDGDTVMIVCRSDGFLIRYILEPVGDIPEPAPATPIKPLKKKKTTKSKR